MILQDRADESSAPGQGVFWGTEVPINSAAALAVSQIRQVGATGPPLDALGVIIPGLDPGFICTAASSDICIEPSKATHKIT